MKIAVFVVTVLLSAACASAQTYSGFAWNQSAPDAVTAQSYPMRAYFDGATPALNGTVLSNVVCAGTASPWLCTGVCVLPLGKHAAVLTTGSPDNQAESVPSSPAVSFDQAPPAATNVAPKK